MTKTEWIENHLSEIENTKTMPFMVGVLAYGELVDEFWDLFHEGLTDNLKEYYKEEN